MMMCIWFVAEEGWVYVMYLSWKTVAPAPCVPVSAVAAPSSAYASKYLIFLFLISHFTVQGNKVVSHLKTDLKIQEFTNKDHLTLKKQQYFAFLLYL